MRTGRGTWPAGWPTAPTSRSPGSGRKVGWPRRSTNAGRRLVRRWPRGRLSLDQAKVIVHALDALPDRVGADVRSDAEARLVALGTGEAPECGGLGMLPQHLRVLGRRVLDVVAPAVAEDEEARRLHEEETHAQTALSLRMKPLGDGATRITMTLPDATATRLATYLDALTSPRSGVSRL
ncbi:DUF222 domain-containing protein, partial [Nocardioides sp. GY 10113]|uniref:DUF222 domain-containing protein n=1 Tax=Nocardioides sp. GY 10113 TaxID=2569761 RepID=UPI0010A7B794